MEENNKTIIEEYKFIGSPDDFKRLYQGDELFKFFQETNERNVGSIDDWDPFTSIRERGSCKGEGYECKLFEISENRFKLFVRVFGSSDSWNDFRSALEQQGLIIPVVQFDEIAFQLMPKKESTIDLYKNAWKLWLNMSDQYHDDVLEGRSKQSKPTMEDYRARIILELGWQVSIRTLSSVKRLGNMGLLD